MYSDDAVWKPNVLSIFIYKLPIKRRAAYRSSTTRCSIFNTLRIITLFLVFSALNYVLKDIIGHANSRVMS